MVTINIQKKDLWLLSAIMLFVVSIGFVIAYNSVPPVPATMGHSADELDVDIGGVTKSLQVAINAGDLGGNFGAWQTMVLNTNYQAATDGFVVVNIYVPNVVGNAALKNIAGYTDGNPVPSIM